MNKYIKQLFIEYKKQVIINIFANILVMFLTIASPIVLRQFISAKNGLGNPSILVLYIVTLIWEYLMMLLVKLYNLKQGYEFKISESMRILKWIYNMDYSEIIKKEPTYLVEKMSGTVDTVYLLFSNVFSSILVSMLTIVVTLVMIAKTNLILFFLFLCLIPVFKVLPQNLNKNLSLRSENMQTVLARNNTLLKSIVSVPDAFKQIDDKSGIMQMARKGFSDVQREKLDINQYAGIYSLVIDFCMVLLTNIINIYSIYLFSLNRIEMSTMVFINLISGIYITALSNVINLDITIMDLKGALSYIDNEIIALQEDDGVESISEINDVEINIKNYGYNKILIREANIKLTKGNVIGLLGKSGSGKSSILKMLLKYIKTDGVYINDVPISKYSNYQLRKLISYVSQDYYLFPGSILDNITIKQAWDENSLKKVLSMPFLEIFKDLPEGLDTVIVENGANLSGGDKQRIMIARALLKKADIYIFDEAFSALDERTALDIQKQIIDNHGSSIVIFVAHNMNLLDKIERKYLLDNGVMVEYY